jgi:DNA uptake protein ComE-like DNA-binding protein
MSFLTRRSQIVQDPHYRFQSLADLSIAAELGVSIDANRATVDDWLRLPGISIHQAKSLVTLQAAGVEFYAIEDVAAALGIALQRIQAWCLVLSFQYRHPDTQILQFNVNVATIAELQSLIDIDLDLAQCIVANRLEQGQYLDLVNFQQRLKLSGALLASLMHQLKFSQ